MTEQRASANSLRLPIEMQRRTFLTAATATTLPLPALAFGHDTETAALLEIGHQTGLSLDDLYSWLEGTDLERIAQNAQRPLPTRWNENSTRAVLAAEAGLLLLQRQEQFPLRDFMLKQLFKKGDPKVLAEVAEYPHFTECLEVRHG